MRTTDAGLDLPSLYRLVTLREAGDAFAHALAHAAELGAGTLVWTRRFDLAEFAVVLEPDQPMPGARRAFLAGMTALADTLAARIPPGKPLLLDWPDTLRLDGAVIGGGRLGEPPAGAAGEPSGAAGEPSGAAGEPSEFLVFGAVVRLHTMRELAPGMAVLGSALAEEGTEEVSAGAILEGFARHLMAAFDEWANDGFTLVAERYLARLPAAPGLRRAIDAGGDLLERTSGSAAAPTRHPLAPRLANPAWRDPATGEPLL